MAKVRIAPSPADQRHHEALGLLGMLVAALPPQRRAFLRDAVGVTATATYPEGPDRQAVLTLVDRAFEAIEGCGQASDRESA